MEVTHEEVARLPLPDGRVLREYQQEAILAVLNGKDNKYLFNIFCGLGKSLIMMASLFLAVSKAPGKSFLVVVPSLELIKQFYFDYILKFQDQLTDAVVLNVSTEIMDDIISTENIMTICDALMDKRSKIILCCEKSLEKVVKASRLTGQNMYMTLFDEAHHLKGQTYRKLVFGESGTTLDGAFGLARFFTGTPVNLTGFVMINRENPEENICGQVAFEMSYWDGYIGGFLQSFEICTEYIKSTTNHIHGPDHMDDDEKRDSTSSGHVEAIYKCIFRSILMKGNTQVLTFHNTVDTASETSVRTFCNPVLMERCLQEVIQQEFPEYDGFFKKLTCVSMDGTTPSSERRDMLQRFEAATQEEIFILSSCRTLNEGVNAGGKANMIVFVDDKTSPESAIQTASRGLRLRPNHVPTTLLIIQSINVDDCLLDDESQKLTLADYDTTTITLLAALQQQDSSIADHFVLCERPQQMYSSPKFKTTAKYLAEIETETETETETNADTETVLPAQLMDTGDANVLAETSSNTKIQMYIHVDDSIQAAWNVKHGTELDLQRQIGILTLQGVFPQAILTKTEQQLQDIKDVDEFLTMHHHSPSLAAKNRNQHICPMKEREIELSKTFSSIKAAYNKKHWTNTRYFWPDTDPRVTALEKLIKTHTDILKQQKNIRPPCTVTDDTVTDDTVTDDTVTDDTVTDNMEPTLAYEVDETDDEKDNPENTMDDESDEVEESVSPTTVATAASKTNENQLKLNTKEYFTAVAKLHKIRQSGLTPDISLVTSIANATEVAKEATLSEDELRRKKKRDYNTKWLSNPANRDSWNKKRREQSQRGKKNTTCPVVPLPLTALPLTALPPTALPPTASLRPIEIPPITMSDDAMDCSTSDGTLSNTVRKRKNDEKEVDAESKARGVLSAMTAQEKDDYILAIETKRKREAVVGYCETNPKDKDEINQFLAENTPHTNDDEKLVILDYISFKTATALHNHGFSTKQLLIPQSDTADYEAMKSHPMFGHRVQQRTLTELLKGLQQDQEVISLLYADFTCTVHTAEKELYCLRDHRFAAGGIVAVTVCARDPIAFAEPYANKFMIKLQQMLYETLPGKWTTIKDCTYGNGATMGTIVMKKM